ncbi:MAG: CAP domain-containing protein, partial [bacterium]|nr:CAP domain-containing protein [bacterium]
RPHLLHPKRTVGYAAFFVAVKLVVLALVVVIPSGLFASLDALDADARAIVTQTNAVRAGAELDVLRADPRLQRSATAKTTDMAAREYFGHRSPDGRGPESFVAAAGYPYAVAGENLAIGFSDPDAVIAAWRASPTHKRNLVDPDYTDIGVSVHAGTFHGVATTFVAQHFGRMKAAIPPAPAPTPPPTMAIAQAKTSWAKDGRGTRLTVTATVARGVRSASASVQGQDIPLVSVPNATDEPSGSALAPVVSETSELSGSVLVPTPPQDLFAIVTNPTITARDTDDVESTTTAPWVAVPIVRPSLADRYTRAVERLPAVLGPLDTAARAVLFGALILFAIAWLLNFVIEIRRQHLDLL